MAGLPSVQKIKREQLQAKHPETVKSEPVEKVIIPVDISAAPINQGGDPQPPPEAPLEEEPEKPLSLEEQWRIKFDQQEQRLRSRDESLKTMERAAKEEVEALKRTVEELRKAVPQPKVEPDPSEELTAEEEATYGSSKGFVTKMTKREIKESLKVRDAIIDSLRAEVEQLKQATTRVETGVASSEEGRFVDNVRRSVKNFDSVISSTEWLDYLKQKVPYSRYTIGNMLDTAHDARDLDSVLEIFEGFKPSRAALAKMASPPLNGGSAPVNTNGTQKPMLKLSDRKKVSEDFRKGRIKEDVLKQWDKLFKEAEAEGRLDLTK